MKANNVQKNKNNYTYASKTIFYTECELEEKGNLRRCRLYVVSQITNRLCNCRKLKTGVKS